MTQEAFRLFLEMLNEVGVEVDWDVVEEKLSMSLNPTTRTISLHWWDADDEDFRELEALLSATEERRE